MASLRQVEVITGVGRVTPQTCSEPESIAAAIVGGTFTSPMRILILVPVFFAMMAETTGQKTLSRRL